MDYKDHLKFGIIPIILITVILSILQFYSYIPQIDIYHSILLHQQFNPLVFSLSFDINFITVSISIIIGMYASLFPDIDIRTSKVYGFSIFIALFLLIIFGITGNLIAVTFCLVFIFSTFFMTHRGVIHSWITGFILGILIMLIFRQVLYGLYFIAGFFTHLVCDQ